MLVLQVIARVNLGGTAKYLFTLSDLLPKIGIKTIIATGYVQGDEIEDSELEKFDFIRIKNLGRKINIIKDIKSALDLRKIIIELQPDIIHTHTFKAGLLVRVQKRKLEQYLEKETKFIHTFHGHLFDDPQFSGSKALLITFIERYLAKKCNNIITVGVSVKNDLNQKGIYSKNLTVSIPPTVEPLSLISKKNALNKFNIMDKNRIRVIWIARVTGVKNPFKVIRIARALPEFDFYMAGGGDLLDKIKAKAPENLKVLGWQDVKEILPIADIFLSTSENEGIPIAMIEAQLAGIPIVATNVGSVSEVVINHKTGLLCDKSERQIVNCIRTLAENKKLRSDFSKNAKFIASKKFTKSMFIKAHKDIYLKA